MEPAATCCRAAFPPQGEQSLVTTTTNGGTDLAPDETATLVSNAASPGDQVAVVASPTTTDAEGIDVTIQTDEGSGFADRATVHVDDSTNSAQVTFTCATGTVAWRAIAHNSPDGASNRLLWGAFQASLV